MIAIYLFSVFWFPVRLYQCRLLLVVSSWHHFPLYHSYLLIMALRNKNSWFWILKQKAVLQFSSLGSKIAHFSVLENFYWLEIWKYDICEFDILEIFKIETFEIRHDSFISPIQYFKINQNITRSKTTMNHPVEPSGWAPEGPDPTRSKIQKTIKIGNFHQYFKLMTHIVMIRSLNRCAAMKWSINICIICMRLSIFQKNSKNGDMTKIMK